MSYTKYETIFECIFKSQEFQRIALIYHATYIALQKNIPGYSTIPYRCINNQSPK